MKSQLYSFQKISRQTDTQSDLGTSGLNFSYPDVSYSAAVATALVTLG